MATAMAGNVEVKQICAVKGKGVFSKTAFKKGDVIFEEKPLVSCQFAWNELYKYKACEFCMQALETAEENSRRLTENKAIILPHPECCEVKPENHVVCPQCQIEYCSAQCRDAAWAQYHRVLCLGMSKEDQDHPINRLLEAWRNIHFPPETATVMLLAKMIATVKQAEDKDAVLGLFSSFVQSTVNEEEQIVHKLLGEQFQDPLELLWRLTSEALYEEAAQQWFTPEGFKSLFALIGRNGQGVGSSSISVWVRNCEALDHSADEKEKMEEYIDQLYEQLDRVAGMFLNVEGSGLYKLQSTCNHSCVPNAEITFPHNNHTLVLVALEAIEPEQEICISYLSECSLDRSRHSRQRILRDNYLFSCNCPKCLSQVDDPDVTSEEEMDDEEEEEEERGTGAG
ncbi:histone-lysine N-trimethyltransferase SMYD5-like [Haliotis rubra]|uniref:histone-lysine N-trimethyltransferase SMYD5-like n=1 Tax=Haliotis rubra TaxID=36100 RepID=UPI001EE5F336|nr:histone-lysine N-trimethyltransferase SMYD5-like [Haliotis rubra]